MTRQEHLQDLQDRSSLLESVIASIDNPMFSVDRNYCYTSFNVAHAEVMKVLFNADIEIGKNILDYHTVDIDRNKAKEYIDRALNGERVKVGYYAGEVALSRRYFEITHNPIFDTDGNVNGVLVIAIDITEKKRIEDELRESEERKRFALESIEAGEWDLNLVDHSVHRSLQHDRIFGYDNLLLEWTYEIFLEHVLPEDKEYVDRTFQEAMEEKSVWNFECRILRHDNEIRWIWACGRHVADATGEPNRMIGIVIDITDRKRSESELRIVQEELESRVQERTIELERKSIYARSLIEASLDPLMTINLERKITDVNKASESITGYTKEELMDKDLIEYFSEPEKLTEGLHEVFDSGFVTDIPLAIIHKNGAKTEVLLNASTYFDENGIAQGVLVAARDITEHLIAEQQIRRQAQLLDNAHEAITLRDLDNRILYWNKGSERLYGWKASEVIGKISHEVIFKGDYSQPLTALKTVKEKGEWSGEMTHQDRNGIEIIVDSRWTLMNDAEGNPESILVINSDITEKKRLEKQLLRSQRLESIGTLAGGMAHDLNNILTPILLSVEFLKEKVSCDEDKNLLDMLAKNVNRGADLIQKVLSFARGVEGERQPIQIASIISDLTKTIKETFPKNVNINEDISSDLWQVSGDATQLHQVLMNLCLNARDAMHDGGTLTISAENFILDEKLALMYIESTIGPHVLISITDSGTGMPPEVVDRLFEPFFTTKKLGEGTGLGLSTALAIVKSHGGFIRVYSEVDKGSTFKVFLPAIPSVDSIEVESQELDIFQGHEELILVVDDEEMIRTMISATVEEHGYRSISASDGAEAIALFAQQKNEIKLVILDLMMPIMDGKACIKALRKLDSKVKIIAVSGLTQTGKNLDVLSSVNAFLTKPFSTQKLLETIQSTMSTN